MKNKIYYLIILLSIITLGFLANLTIKRHENRIVKNIIIQLKDFKEDSLLNKEDIKKIISQPKENFTFENKKITEILIIDIEKKLQVHPFIKKAEVFFSPNGKLNAHLWQHRPIARIQNQQGEYYLTNEAKSISLSYENTAKVILVSGNFSKKEHDSLKELINFINKDFMLNKEVIGIKKLNSKELKLAIQLKNHLVILGAIDNFREKITNLKTFYKQHLNKKHISDYKTIDLQYKGQIIATKRQKA